MKKRLQEVFCEIFLPKLLNVAISLVFRIKNAKNEIVFLRSYRDIKKQRFGKLARFQEAIMFYKLFCKISI